MTYYITCMQTFLKLFQVWINVDHPVCYNYIVSLVVCPEMHKKNQGRIYVPAKTYSRVQSPLYVHFVNASLSDCRRHCFDRRLYKVDELWKVPGGWGMLFLLRQYKPRQGDGFCVDGVSSTHLDSPRNETQPMSTTMCATTCYLLT